MDLARPGPVEKQERLLVVDILRGFALFGILMVNIQVAGQAGLDLWAPRGSNTVAFFIMEAFFSSKFYPLYSFLFGLGMSLQMLRLEGRGLPFTGIYLRRLFWLFVIGSLHAVLIWEGDILTAYALLGVLLVLCRRLKPRTLVILALALILFQIFTIGPFGKWFSAHTTAEAEPLEWYQLGHLFRTATYPELVAYRFELWYPVGLVESIRAEGSLGMQAAVLGYYLLSIINIAGLFLLGLAAGKSGVLQDVEGHLRFWRRAFRVSFPLGLALNIGRVTWENGLRARTGEGAMLPWENTLAYALAGLIPVLTLGYISGLVILSRKGRFLHFLRFLAPAGQMALTNYLAQSLFFTWLFFGCGFGLYGKVPGMGVIAIAIGFYLLQLVASRLWLRRFRFGPAEWLWRSLTYWKPQPIRLPEEAHPVSAP